MTVNSEPQPERRLPIPAPPETPSPEPGGLKGLLRQRFLIVALIILIFLGFMFFRGTYQRLYIEEAQEAAKEEKHEAAPKEKHDAAPKIATPAPPPAVTHEAAPEHAAKAPPHPPAVAPSPRMEPVKGEKFTRALIKIMDDQVNKPIFGWRPNSILFGKFGLTDNVNNIQLGVLDVVIRTVLVLNENMTRFAITEAYDPNIKEARDFFMVSPDKYWFPSASGKYREAMGDLGQYIDSLRKGRARFYTRVDNLIALFATYKDLLGSSYHNLIKDAEADGSAISWWVADDYFYYAQGLALGMSEMLEAVKEDFHLELQKKGSHKLLEDAIHALHTASHLSPWVVTSGGKDGILANHRANMSTYIGEAEHVIATLQTVLATN
ncbi:MAG: DUF2333 family protein [Deltaproteobacteria bacterium]|nr:MAG: DUF2333 family protein [Deltaproteobacteria bacterium]